MYDKPAKIRPHLDRGSIVNADRHIVQTEVPEPEDAQKSIMFAIGAEIRTLRSAQKMTLSTLSQMSGISAGMISRIENGMTNASLATLSALADALQVPLSQLLAQCERIM